MEPPATTPPAAVQRCASPGCGKPSTLQCPQCKEKALPAEYAFFCSQACFKTSWPMHKLLHAIDPAQLKKQIAEQAKPKADPRFQGFKFTGKIRPGYVSPLRSVPAHIPRPDYAMSLTGESEAEKRLRQSTQIVQHTPEQIQKARTAGRLAAEILAIGASMIKPGVTTDEIDRVVHEATIERNAYPSPLGYNGFPKSLCTSVNEIVCHGIPDSRDIVNLDISLYINGFHSDVNATYPVGEIDAASKLLVDTTREALDLAIAACKPGMLYRDIGPIISRHVGAQNFSVVRTYCGHGVAELFHCPPSIPHYNKNKAIGTMKPGHIFTIEPMINVGTWQDVLWPDDWTSATKDGQRSAQFEHTILITEEGHEVLTAPVTGKIK